MHYSVLLCIIMFHMHRCEEYAHTEACETYQITYTTVSLRMNLRGSKHVVDNRN